MKITLLAIGQRMPEWVNQGYQTYSKRLPHECRLELKALAAGKRSQKSTPEKAIQDEGERLLAAVPKGARIVALDERGKPWDTQKLSQNLGTWLQDGRDTALMVGGADGLSADCLQQAELRWSLSSLTLPHGLVRVLVAEQLYRAWSLLNHHPYHRE